MNHTLRIGIDFGGVLSSLDTKDGKEHRNTCIDMSGCINALKTLKKDGHKLYIISFCGKTRAKETLDSLNKEFQGLFEECYFTKTKAAKADICNHIGCDLMIDDTREVLLEIKKTAHNTKRYLFETRHGEWDAIVLLIEMGYGFSTLNSPKPINNLKKLCYL